MSLQDWERKGWVEKHKTSPQEIEGLFQIADRDLKDCQARDLSDDWQLNIAYNAALQSAKAALAAAGYRTSREAQHFRIVQSLAFTLRLEKSLIDKLDKFRKKRNISDYERAGLVSEGEVEEAIALAHRLRKQAEDWIRTNYAHLVSHKKWKLSPDTSSANAFTTRLQTVKSYGENFLTKNRSSMRLKIEKHSH